MIHFRVGHEEVIEHYVDGCTAVHDGEVATGCTPQLMGKYVAMVRLWIPVRIVQCAALFLCTGLRTGCMCECTYGALCRTEDNMHVGVPFVLGTRVCCRVDLCVDRV